jgi:hypothetical protein
MSEVHCIWLHLDCCTVPQALSHDQFMLSLSYVLLMLQSVCHIWARWEIWIVHTQMSLDRQCVIYTMYGFIFSLSLRYYLLLHFNMTLVFPKISMSTVACPNRHVYLLGKQTSVWQWSISIYVLVPVDSGMDGEVRWFDKNNLSPMSCVES